MTSDDEATRAGLLSRAGAFFRTHPRGTAITGGALALVIFGGGALAAGAATAPTSAPATSAPAVARSASAAPSSSAASTPKATPKATSKATPKTTARSAPSPVPSAVPLRTCTVAGAASDARLGTFEGTVLDAKSGATLFDRSGSTPARTGSVMKTLTTAVALADLGADYRFTTKVVGSTTGTGIALVGGGDATLSATPAGSESIYPGAPKLSTLAAEVKAKLGTKKITNIVLDDSYWSDADAYDPSWPASELTIGYQPRVVSLMVDGDRANPTLSVSPRSSDPVGRAGEAFRTALVAAKVSGASTAALTRGTAKSTDVLAEVKSQPVSTLIGQMIPNSDNTLAEMMARVSSKVSGSDGSAASLTAVYQKALKGTYGLDASTIKIVDGSGESANNGVPSALEASLMRKVLAGEGSLKLLYDSLPVSGQSGTLSTRFTGANAIARGAIHAKTGWIDSAYTLAGTVDAKDGTQLTFAFYAIGNVSGTAREALDTLATAVYSCGANLSDD
ncbi:D-alanyl-D-alanine carboxypeptidase/D-alanyl-D-alanine-endopeptidase (penicillin-binding protein 4) [Frondihabitans sp. PhB188]|uniref:D-alanyl-D-alanine carboxypeptidase/D-alanyl-D-alanine-endopeptidase n=1 Tax=Frondihabitans sp. PhB188 TaxID=2485200 RepID=UPI000F46E177|nr:D-alanyl-D-alanine carboxypeptidase [Frondihabitans sp. PhB188]ROQ36709.1 D-alanyl-D-alanine carboxypeptidase/D-alanyl-D-alanine-endopeptidase (penicillin-binding protein 4) [Frondihabitans sp. PhB188]